MTRYRALALQSQCRSVSGVADTAAARGLIREAIARIHAEIRASTAFIGPDTGLVVLPEYVLTGFPMGEPIDVWRERACLRADGPEWEALGAIAADLDLHLAGNAYEVDEEFPDLYFQTCFVIAPSGEVVLRYRRLVSMFSPTPHDVWDRYLEVHGLEGVFPVVDTPLGVLAPIASEEVLYPEIVRCFVLRGAEVLLHSSAEAGSRAATTKSIARRARALENLAYVVSANTGGMTGTAIPSASTDGGSCVIDPSGRILAEAGTGPSMVAHAAIDLDALRAERRRPGMGNLLARQRWEVVADTYARARAYPPGTMRDGPPEDRGHFVATLRGAIDDLVGRGTLR